MNDEVLRKVHRLTLVLSAVSLLLTGCPNQDEIPEEWKAPQLETFVEVISPEFFSGTWQTVNTEPPHSMVLDLKAMELTTILGDEQVIEDVVPVDQGYALLVFDPKHSAHPNGLHHLLVLKKYNEKTILLLESPDLVSVFVRKN